MMSSGLLRRVALVRTDVSEEPSTSIRVTRIGELGTTQATTSNRRTQRTSVQFEFFLFCLHMRFPPDSLRILISCYSLTSNMAAFWHRRPLAQWKHWPSYCWLPCNASLPGWRAYPWKFATCGCLGTTRMFILRLPSNDGIRRNTLQYVPGNPCVGSLTV
jgi:hypothetical protein